MGNLHQSLSPRERANRVWYLVIAALPFLGSVFFNQGFRLPFLDCPLLRFAGVPCPAWGMTRSFMAILRGNWQQAVSYHLFGMPLFLGLLALGLHLSLELKQNRKIQSGYIEFLRQSKVQLFSFCLLLGYHATRLYPYVLSGELQQRWQHSLLYHLLF